MKKKAGRPIFPRKKSDPVGTDDLERKAIRAFRVRIRKIGQQYIKALKELKGEPWPQPLTNRDYHYRIDPTSFKTMLDRIGDYVDRLLLEGGFDNLWFLKGYVEPADSRGLSQERANIAAQSATYRASVPEVGILLTTEPYKLRLAMLAARQFELMKGLTGTMKAELGRVLSDGLARGQNPRTVAKQIRERIGVSESRAERIARTEIPTALRKARMAESARASREYGLSFKQMHMSALSPTTRPSHAARHGRLYTIEEQQEWWEQGSNSINCKCSTITVLVDSKGEPVLPDVQEAALAMKS